MSVDVNLHWTTSVKMSVPKRISEGSTTYTADLTFKSKHEDTLVVTLFADSIEDLQLTFVQEDAE
tara:strand:- start:634 stop:828 length:195 start_codon:yes stop_codon:yes gene_type:complete